MSSENLHAPRERLLQQTLNLHFAIVSLMEEVDAIDWYRQCADDAEDATLKELLLLHNVREEMEPSNTKEFPSTSKSRSCRCSAMSRSAISARLCICMRYSANPMAASSAAT
jgi:hypothetical protein